MKKIQLSLLALTLTAMPMAARQLTPAEALSAAGMSSANTAKGVLRAPSELKLIYTTEKNNLKTSYVFNRNNSDGFVILAADDVVTPIIGYSDKGSFDPNNIPFAMKGYLESIGEEIAWGAANPSALRPVTETADYQPIAPLCKTEWDQGDPYYLMCPTRNINGATYYCVTGCLATAMAQIMKVHEWPTTGTGSYTYNYQDGYYGGTYSASSNFAEHTYDWANMLDIYDIDGTYTKAEANAVAQLMYDCGVSVSMSYSPQASGAVGVIVPNSLATYFGYDKAMQHIFRKNYLLADWNGIAYKEISEGRPTLITGSNSTGGHAFVCDGYDKDGYFHINWGWGGASDGYFLLTALDPNKQGIGGSSAGYTNGQAMTIGIKPAVAGSKPVITITSENAPFSAAADSYSRTATVTFGSAATQLINWTATQPSVAGAFGVKLVNKSNGETSYLEGSNTELQFLQYLRNYSVPGSSFPESGDYVVSPAFKPVDGDWIDVRCCISYSSAISCHIENNTIYFSPINDGSIEVTNLTADARAFINNPLTYTFNVSCTRDEYIGNIQSSLYRKFTNKFYKVATGETENLSISKGETKTITWKTDFSKDPISTVKAGTYYLRISDGSENVLAEIEIKLEEDPGELILDNDAFYAQINDVDTIFGTRSKPLVINPNDEVFFKMDVTSGYINDLAQITLYSLSGFTMAKAEKANISGAKGETIKLSVPQSIFEGIPANTTVYLRLLTDNNGKFPATLGMRTPVYFQLSDGAGVEDVIVDSNATAPVEYFNLQGMPVATPESGQLLIRRQGSKVSKVIIK